MNGRCDLFRNAHQDNERLPGGAGQRDPVKRCFRYLIARYLDGFVHGGRSRSMGWCRARTAGMPSVSGTGDGVDRVVYGFEADYDTCHRGDKEKERGIDPHGVVDIETGPEPCGVPPDARTLGPPPQNDARWNQQAQRKTRVVDDLAGEIAEWRPGSRIRRQTHVELMDLGENFLILGNVRVSADDGCVIRIHEYGRSSPAAGHPIPPVPAGFHRGV